MTIKDAMKGISTEEQERRMNAVERINVLWYKKQACEDKEQIKRLDKKIRLIARQEQFWMKNVAFFLY